MNDPSREEIKRQLQQMDPYEFEELVAELWKLQGYKTTVRQGSGDRGIDVEATKDVPFEQKILIQAKRYRDDSSVGSKEVRNYATLYQQVPNADNVVIVTSSDFTTEAESLARDLNLKTVDGGSLIDLIIDLNDESSIVDEFIVDNSQEQSADVDSVDESQEQSVGVDSLDISTNSSSFSTKSGRDDRDRQKTHNDRNSVPEVNPDRKSLRSKVKRKIENKKDFAINWDSDIRTYTCKIIFQNGNGMILKVNGIEYKKIKNEQLSHVSGTFEKDNGKVNIYISERTSNHALTVVRNLITITDSHFEDIFRFD